MQAPVLTCSIVTYKNNFEILAQAISSLLNSPVDVELFIFDNSPTDKIKRLCYDDRIHYFHSETNVGFGKGHNAVIRKVIDQSDFHLVMNPDVYFDNMVLPTLLAYMQQHPEVGLVMPKVLNPDGSIQHNCRLLPSPKNLILRRFFHAFPDLLKDANHLYEMRFSDYNQTMEVPFLSGCFMFLSTNALRRVGFFDERFFLYVEDADLSRRIHQVYKTIYLPKVEVYHYHEKGSYKNWNLLWYNAASAVQYFNKWGWLDREREVVNESVINRLSGLTLSH